MLQKILTLVTITSYFIITSYSIYGLNFLDNLQESNKGDYIITAQNNIFSLFHIFDKNDDTVFIEEISIPKTKKDKLPWKEWVWQGASNHHSWIIYGINLYNGSIKEIFSFSRQVWLDCASHKSFIEILLNLDFQKIPIENRRYIGASTQTKILWQPRMVYEGKEISKVEFDAYQSCWPNDNSILSGKTIDAYTPSKRGKYPYYFPYWLQVRGALGKAQIRIVDSGKNMKSPKVYYTKY